MNEQTEVVRDDKENDESRIIQEYANEESIVNENGNENTSSDNRIINTDDCIDTSELHQDRPTSNKYLLNNNFNKKMTLLDVDEKKIDEENGSEFEQSSDFIPSELKDVDWPEGHTSFVSNIANGKIDLNLDSALIDNPLLEKDTVLLNHDSPVKNDTNWKKFKDNEFYHIIPHKQMLKNMPSSISTVPDTFANKINRIGERHKITESPFKIFDSIPASDIKEKPKSKLNLNPQNDVPDFISASEGLFDRILTSSSSNGTLKKGLGTVPILDMKTPVQSRDSDEDNDDDDDDDEFSDREPTKDLSNTDDITSDAEEFTSIKSTTRKMVNAGDQLFKDIQNGVLNKGLVIPNMNNSQYDYTSADEDDNMRRSVDKRDYESTVKSKFDNVELLRKKMNLDALKYNDEFNVRPPKIKSKLQLRESNDTGDSKPVVKTGHINGLHLIPGEEYKNKVYDKKLKKYVSKSQLVDDSSYTFENENGNGVYDYGFDTENIFEGDEETEDKFIGGNETQNIFTDLSSSSGINNTIIKNGEELEEDDDGEAFSITDKLLIDVINESYPIEDWDVVTELNISGARLEQISHLNRMTPNLWYLDASNNSISQNFGIPNKIQSLDLSHNKFSSLSAKFGGNDFMWLQNLNMSHNELKDLRCMKELRSLNSLDLSFNIIKGLNYLDNFRMLHTLNLSNNHITGKIDFRNFMLWFLEDLILDNNEIEHLVNISELPKINNISANNNRIKSFIYHDGKDTEDEIPKHASLRRVCLNNNLLEEIDLREYTSLREIQIDCNPKLEVIEGKFQDVVKFTSRYNSASINHNVVGKCLQNGNITTLHLIGGRMPNNLAKMITMNSGYDFCNVQTLDISAMELVRLPIRFSEMFPLLKDLNLNFNNLDNLHGIEGCQYIRQLKLLGNRIKKLEDITDYCNSLMKRRLQLLDVRVNPITKGLYPCVFYDGNDTNMEDNFQLLEMDDVAAFSAEYALSHTPAGLSRWENKCIWWEHHGGDTFALQNWRYSVEEVFTDLVMLDGRM